MADAPAGNKLAGVEILLLVILGLGALAVLSGNPLVPVSSQQTTASKQKTVAPHCGITLSRPKPNEAIINGAVTIVGTITPCNTMQSLTTTTVTVQVVDSSGAPVSTFTTVPMNTATSDTGTFSTTIPITGNPLKGTGFVIVTGPNQPDGTALNARVPVKL